jgi:hypothetical protein
MLRARSTYCFLSFGGNDSTTSVEFSLSLSSVTDEVILDCVWNEIGTFEVMGGIVSLESRKKALLGSTHPKQHRQYQSQQKAITKDSNTTLAAIPMMASVSVFWLLPPPEVNKARAVGCIIVAPSPSKAVISTQLKAMSPYYLCTPPQPTSTRTLQDDLFPLLQP